MKSVEVNYTVKLKCNFEGTDQKTISTLFKIATLTDVSRYLQQARDSLIKEFVPRNLGPKVKTREEWLEHNSYIAKNIFETADENLILIADGTYCYCQKSRKNNL